MDQQGNPNPATQSPVAPASVPSPPPNRPPVGPNYWRKPRSKILYIVIAILLVAGAAAAYWFLVRPEPKAVSTGTDSSQNIEAAAPTSEFANFDKSYTSPNFNLAFAYPEDWSLTDEGGGILTAQSPLMKLGDKPGHVVLRVRDKAQKLTEFDKGNAVATRDSEKVAYSKPTQTQRGNTYLSFLQYAGSASGLDGIYITGDNGYQKAQAIPLVDVNKVEPVISLTFTDADGKAMSVSETLLDNAEFYGPLKTMLQSFSIN